MTLHLQTLFEGQHPWMAPEGLLVGPSPMAVARSPGWAGPGPLLTGSPLGLLSCPFQGDS